MDEEEVVQEMIGNLVGEGVDLNNWGIGEDGSIQLLKYGEESNT